MNRVYYYIMQATRIVFLINALIILISDTNPFKNMPMPALA